MGDDVLRAFRGIQVFSAALALVASSVAALTGGEVIGVPLSVVGFAFFTVATAAALAVVAVDPAVLTRSSSSSGSL